MKITVLYFASLRESLGIEREEIDVPAGLTSAGALRDWLCARGDAWLLALGPGRAVRVAVARKLATPDTVLVDRVEVAFFPPVTGG